MAVLAGRTHQGRIEAGDSLIGAASAVDTGRVKGRLAAFMSAHRALAKGQTAVDKEELTLGTRRAVVAERDVDQDEVVERVVAALIGDGLPRSNPFKSLSTYTPTKLKALAHAAEAKALTAIVTRARKRKDLSAKTLSALNAAEKAAKGVVAALGAVAPAQQKVDAARSRRDAMVQSWETSFAALKRGARAAEDDGAKGLFGALFVSTAPAKKPAKKKPAPVA